MTIKYYQVGGCVRDELLGIKSKDIDYAVEAPSFDAMVQDIKDRGCEIFLEKPEYQTVRARFNNEVVDFVLCRKESFYTDGRRPDSVTIGTIDDDLARRDFTVNAIAKREDGTYYDPWSGVYDLKNRKLRCVGNAYDRFSEDSLRMLRAIRFSITKNLVFDSDVVLALHEDELVEKLDNISHERIREELNRCFAADTLRTLRDLEFFYKIRDKIFSKEEVWLKATTENR